jgi:ribosomal protein S18 acetylase RimI-like enzyme
MLLSRREIMSLPIEIRTLAAHEDLDAASLLARGMRDNPNHLQVFGQDPRARERALKLMFTTAMRKQLSQGIVMGAYCSDELVGVIGMMPPGRCLSAFAGKMSALLALVLGIRLSGALRLQEWIDDWVRNDAEVPHWHLGPMAVEPRLQGRGIGSALLRDCCARIDGERLAGYLENDKAENLPFFERFGFEVDDEHVVLGTRNWFMLRRHGTRRQ